MATGKTHARWMRLILDGTNLSGDSRQIGSFGMEYATAEAQGWADGVVHYTLGHPSHIFSGYQAVFNNTASTGSHTELSAVEKYFLTLFVGIRAAPAVGDPTFSSDMEQMNYKIDGTDSVLINVDMIKGVSNITNAAAFGRALAIGTSLSATTNGDSIDNGASSANGATGFLHVTATSSGNWTLKVQDSPDDGAWSDLFTFDIDGSAVTADTKSASGTVDRYLRFQATRTAGTTSFWCAVIRN
jgi:hypothetical protein